ncbi:LytTR family DNA-binding domain-containing protein [Wandonia haliotis]|uniref:LytTR family DNA-binding domain-containing protein n=1 Tax=Wandonia haliotis TaxID=574963 RepID=A0ABN1MR08_9FLAO
MKVVIVDDERLARAELTQLLGEYDDVQIIGEAKNVDEATDLLKEKDADVVFLDIQMPEKNGFELLEQLPACPDVVFVTAYDEYAIKAFEVNALDYLLKPVDPKRLSETLDKLRPRISSEKEENSDEKPGKLSISDRIFIKDGEKCWFVELDKVRMFESEGNYVKVHFDNFRPLILRSLNNLEDRLDSKHFFRANRKYIINLKWVSRIESWFNGGLQVELREGEKVEISRRQAIKFKDLMSL